MLELILGGSGGELSPRFLSLFGRLCVSMNVTIIADEIMTGGRVGPGMTVTQNSPIEFRQAVGYITMGKIMNCGLVLERKPNSPQEGSVRGSSTTMDAGEACRLWLRVVERLDRIPERRQEVITLLGFAKDAEMHWGVGCLVFTNKARVSITKGLKNRHLPMLEDSKLRKGSCITTEWTRSSVCERLLTASLSWIEENERLMVRKDPFVSAIVDFIQERDDPWLTAKDLLSFIGPLKSAALRKQQQQTRVANTVARRGRCNKTSLTFATDALCLVLDNAPCLFKKMRKKAKRTTVYVIQREALLLGRPSGSVFTVAQ